MHLEGDLSSAGLLRLTWLASPALPIGGFSYSEGLEAAIEWGGVTDEISTAQWAIEQLQLTLARAELRVVAQAHAGWQHDDRAELQALDRWVLQTRESAELLQQTRQMGHSLLEWIRLHHPEAPACFEGLAPTYPLAFAFAAQRAHAPVQPSCLAYAFGWAENLVAAAVKSIPLGQSAGQRILARLVEAIPQVVATALEPAPSGALSRQSFSPMLAILSSRHEIQYSRLFRS